MKNKRTLTYISLFSGAGIGCYGFKSEGFECVATNEMIERRLDIQKFNNKCKYDTGYLLGDISKESVRKSLLDQVELWEKHESIKRIDVLIATPPCQGMSVANHKKRPNEIVRNSLVVESLKIINEIRPIFFVIENVPAFMKTLCTDSDGKVKPISEAIRNNLGKEYSYVSWQINFKDYGACSSRQRTLVIGVCSDYADEVSACELLPRKQPEKTLFDVIGGLKSLSSLSEIDKEDIYHAFRPYPEHMRSWISGLKEGQSAFENTDDAQKPHTVLDGKIVINKQKNGDKYRRQFWNKPGPCVHTRNDQLASQNTIHPHDDRVFSIRELMLMMTVPKSFKWDCRDLDELNALPLEKKVKFLKSNGIKIRQTLGEAVPTAIFREIANRIKKALEYEPVKSHEINKIVSSQHFMDTEDICDFINKNHLGISAPALSRVAELANTKRTDNAAFFTTQSLITEMFRFLPDIQKDTIRVLEPSAGVGNFVPFILKKYDGKNIELDLMDIDGNSLDILRTLTKNWEISDRVKIRYLKDDFLTHDFKDKYDLVVGNPPFYKLKSNDPRLRIYRSNAVNKKTTNTCSFFLDKACSVSRRVVFVMPKSMLNAPEFADTRDYVKHRRVEAIVDFGEKGFPGVLIETISVFIDNESKPSATKIFSCAKQIEIEQRQSYIFDSSLPYWVIFRNKEFDEMLSRLELNVFSVFRDRQITNRFLHHSGDIRVLKSGNISDDGRTILNIDGYDTYISEKDAQQTSVYSYLSQDNVYLTPNMTYKPRVLKKPSGVLVNGSIAILIPKVVRKITEEQLLFFSSDEYRHFYQVARNYQTRSLNVDICSVYFYGLLKQEAFSRNG